MSVDVIADPVKVALARMGIGKTTLYKEIAAGRIKACKLGKKTLISRQSQQDWLDGLTVIPASRKAA